MSEVRKFLWFLMICYAAIFGGILVAIVIAGDLPIVWAAWELAHILSYPFLISGICGSFAVYNRHT